MHLNAETQRRGEAKIFYERFIGFMIFLSALASLRLRVKFFPFLALFKNTQIEENSFALLFGIR
jgi:hypothetical protein